MLSIDRNELARRIRTSREACCLTQDEVARHLGISRSSFVQLEAAKRSVSSLELDQMAYLFGRDVRGFLRDEPPKSDALAALFRASSDAKERPAILAKLRECMAIGRELTNLEQLLGLGRDLGAVAIYPLPKPANRWGAIQQGQRLGEEERRRLSLGAAPIPDLVQLLESQGVRTGLVDLPNDVSGLTLSDPEVGLFVVANRTHHHLRRRFSLAHEYGHVLADRDRSGLLSRSSARGDLIEVRANAFAASFLLPEDGVRQFVAGLGKGKPSRSFYEVFDEAGSLDVEGRTDSGSQKLQLYDVVQLAHRFVVSRLSTLFRLRNLRLISESEFEELKKLDEEGKGKRLAELLGMAEPDHGEMQSSFGYRFLGLVLEAYRREEISHGKLRELMALLDLAADDLDRLLDQAGLDE